MPICKNCGDNNKKIILNYTPKSYTTCPEPAVCPEPYACSEILDSACVQYTNNNILYCGTTFVVISKFENLESALQSLLDIICQTPPRCALEVNIVPNPDDEDTPTLTATNTPTLTMTPTPSQAAVYQYCTGYDASDCCVAESDYLNCNS